MTCTNATLGGVPALNSWKGLEPICKIPPSSQFQQIQCPLNNKFRTSKLCNLLPPGVTDSIVDFLANLPVILLFIASTPARFFYCVTYQFLANFDYFVQSILYSVINPIIDFLTEPLVYLTIGLSDGENASAFSPPSLVGILTQACLPDFLKSIYQGIGDVFYGIGYALGFILGLFIDLYDIILYGLCSLVTFAVDFTICFALGIPYIYTGGGGTNFIIYPFYFLADLLKDFINCGCVLGQYPSFHIGICLAFGASCPSQCKCGFGFSPPTCPAIPEGVPPSPISEYIITSTETVSCLSETSDGELINICQNESGGGGGGSHPEPVE